MAGGAATTGDNKMATDNQMAKADGGTHEVTTVGGCKLWLSVKDGHVYVKDESGSTAEVTIADVIQSNGVIHVVNTKVQDVLPTGWQRPLGGSGDLDRNVSRRHLPPSHMQLRCSVSYISARLDCPHAQGCNTRGRPWLH